MRNFSAINAVNFHSFTINAGEYVSNVRSLDVVRALADAFEARIPDVVDAWLKVTKLCDWEETKITFSEYEVLKTLFEFTSYVDQAIREDGWNSQSKVFSYHNLNTGKSVVWSHSVC